ncbi:hypothetical protein HNR46_000094 [Haloferula luteola]|uniref:Uncharacterized protein n=1 Tax=Haloferula luteola TaxID=595692 RepID=A0A840UY36_9BACT|nr:hypothetical protein [Haloferula luteola]MBB5349873.1 hypothetical protein [Haloferula luteola]
MDSVVAQKAEASAFDEWWASEAPDFTDPERAARLAWDAALCAAGSACLQPAEAGPLPPKNGNEIHSAVTRLHSWNSRQ